MSKNLIVRAELSGPPSSAQSFRDLTFYSEFFHDANVLIESEPEWIDVYWKWMKARGLLDYVAQFVRPFEELGLAVDFEKRPRATILVTRIVEENLPAIYRELAGVL